MKKERLLKILQNFKGKKILVIADLILDLYIWGTPKRISREAPVLILKKKEEWAVPGGGANVVMNLKDLGAEPIPVGFVGEDIEGDILLNIFRKKNVNTEYIKKIKNFKTIKKVRILAGFENTSKQQIVRYDEENISHMKKLDLPLNETDGIIISDYGYNSFDFSFLKKRNFSLPVIVDSRFRLNKFKGMTSITPNEEEAEFLTKMRISEDFEAIEASNKIMEKLKPQAILMTRGAKGILVHKKGYKPLLFPSHLKGQVADTTGAGDTVLAVYTLSLLSGGSFEESAYIANISGTIKVKKLGTATVSYEELKNEVERLP